MCNDCKDPLSVNAQEALPVNETSRDWDICRAVDLYRAPRNKGDERTLADILAEAGIRFAAQGATEPDDVRWAVNVLLEKIAEKFEGWDTFDLFRMLDQNIEYHDRILDLEEALRIIARKKKMDACAAISMRAIAIAALTPAERGVAE